MQQNATDLNHQISNKTQVYNVFYQKICSINKRLLPVRYDYLKPVRNKTCQNYSHEMYKALII